VLSLRQPWAWLVVRPDVTDPLERAALWEADQIKAIENRVWKTKLRGWFLVHASANSTKQDYAGCQMFLESMAGDEPPPVLPSRTDLDYGGIVGAARLDGVLPKLGKEWPLARWRMVEQFGYQLGAVEPIPFLPCSGTHRFWRPTPEVARQLELKIPPWLWLELQKND
jgi:hypothetical protein